MSVVKRKVKLNKEQYQLFFTQFRLLFSTSLILLNLVMNSNSDDWEGFESYNEDNIRLSCQPQTQVVFQPDPLPQIQIKIAINPPISSSSPTKKVINFKSKNRKPSCLHTQIPKKQVQKKEVQLIKEHKRLSTFVQRPIKRNTIMNTKDTKEQSIPIFRFPNLTQNGKLIYRGMLGKSVQEYFSNVQNDQIRNSWQTVLSYEGDQDDLTFDSKFESGNLESVRKINNQYHLYLTPDTNTKGHRQWFYFTASSCKKCTVKIIIHNFKKRLSLFQSGMRPYGKKLQESVEFWMPIGSNIKYQKEQSKITDYRQRFNIKKPQNYCLSFDLQIQASSAICISSCIPYTYTYLKTQLIQFHLNSFRNITIQESILCKSLAGLEIPLITINSQLQKQAEPKRYIIINARSHPGESSSSWVAQGIIQKLYTSQKLQNILKQSNVIVKIVPMLNPDGVYMGNYRTGVMGIDFNRLFLTGKPIFFPEIQGLRQLVRNCKAQGDVDIYLDLHGHSILPGCFIFGPDPVFSPSSEVKKFQTQLKSSKYFANKHCIAGQIHNKAETSRVYFQVQQGIYSLTCQNSLGLFYNDTDKFSKQQFQSKDWKQFGKQLIIAIIKEYDKNNTQDYDQMPFQHSLTSKHGEHYDNLSDLHIGLKRFKTDNKDLQKQIDLVNQLQIQNKNIQRQLKTSKSITEQIESLNDSDNQSEDLSHQKRHELFNFVKKVVEKREAHNRNNSQSKKQQLRSKQKKGSDKGITSINLKQYRFGHQQITLTDLLARRRLLSMPKASRAQKINQSYIIRKTISKPYPSQLILQSYQNNKRFKTQVREESRKKDNSRFQYYCPSDAHREKQFTDHLFAKRN